MVDSEQEPFELRHRSPEAGAAYLQGYKSGLLAAANSLNLSPQDIRLAAGELTAREMLVVRAVLH